MYRRLLVPLDGSQVAEMALPYVEELAGRLGSGVRVLHVCDPGEKELRHMHEIYVQHIADHIRSRAAAHGKGEKVSEVGVEWVVTMGEAPAEIIDYAERSDTSLIVMATHGRSGIGRWALGSVADRVLRGTNRPVALVPARGARPEVPEKGLLQRIVLPLDGSELGEAILPYIEDLAGVLKTEVILLQVVSRAQQVYAVEGLAYVSHLEEHLESLRMAAAGYLDGVARRLQGGGISAQTVVRVGSPAEEIISLAEEIDADAVAMSTRGRSGLKRWVLGSVADRVLYQGSRLVILVRAPEKGRG